MLPDQAVTNSVRGFSKELANMWVIAPFLIERHPFFFLIIFSRFFPEK